MNIKQVISHWATLLVSKVSVSPQLYFVFSESALTDRNNGFLIKDAPHKKTTVCLYLSGHSGTSSFPEVDLQTKKCLWKVTWTRRKQTNSQGHAQNVSSFWPQEIIPRSMQKMVSKTLTLAKQWVWTEMNAPQFCWGLLQIEEDMCSAVTQVNSELSVSGLIVPRFHPNPFYSLHRTPLCMMTVSVSSLPVHPLIQINVSVLQPRAIDSLQIK